MRRVGVSLMVGLVVTVGRLGIGEGWLGAVGGEDEAGAVRSGNGA
jgi:hypothetical protein